jgi:DNA-binding transcriptional regulator YhcF (GntR family)
VQRHEPDGITVQARRLLQLAIEQEGPATMKIPGWRAAGMTSDVWQRVIGALKFAGVVETQAGEGTFVTYEHQTVAYVLDEIRTGKVRVRPAPPPGMSVRSV